MCSNLPMIQFTVTYALIGIIHLLNEIFYIGPLLTTIAKSTKP